MFLVILSFTIHFADDGWGIGEGRYFKLHINELAGDLDNYHKPKNSGESS